MFKNGQFLVVEGNIGAGKTSLCQMLARDWNARLILEEFSDNPFLPLFYAQPDRYAFPVELFFMTERHKQLQALLLEQDLFQQYTVSDYVFSKTLLFAGENLQGEELRLFQRLFETLNASFPKPDLLLYLHRDVHHLSANIRKRNRRTSRTCRRPIFCASKRPISAFSGIAPICPSCLPTSATRISWKTPPCTLGCNPSSIGNGRPVFGAWNAALENRRFRQNRRARCSQ